MLVRCIPGCLPIHLRHFMYMPHHFCMRLLLGYRETLGRMFAHTHTSTLCSGSNSQTVLYVCVRVIYNFNNCCRCRWCSLSFLYVAYAAVAPIFIYKRNKRVWYSFSILFQKIFILQSKNFFLMDIFLRFSGTPVSMFSCFPRTIFWIRCSLFWLWTTTRTKKSLGIEYTGVFCLIYRVFFTLQHMKCFWNCLLLYSLFRTFSIILFLSLSFSLYGVSIFSFVHTFTTRSPMKLRVHHLGWINDMHIWVNSSNDKIPTFGKYAMEWMMIVKFLKIKSSVLFA